MTRIWRAVRPNPCEDEDDDHECEEDHTVREVFFHELSDAKRFVESVAAPDFDWSYFGLNMPPIKNKWRSRGNGYHEYSDWYIETIKVR